MRIVSKTILISLLLCFCVTGLRAQTITVVSGTILDPNGVPYASATVKVTLTQPVASASAIVTATNSPVIIPIPATTSAMGTFSMNLVANGSITPAATTYNFSFCAPVVPPPLGTGNSCFSITGVTIAGGTQDLSATANASAVALINVPHVYSTAPAAGTSSISATTMTTAPTLPAAGTLYTLRTYLTQTVLGASCGADSTIAVNAIFQDPNAAAPQTVVFGTYTVTTNGTLGNIPLTSGSSAFNILAKASTVVQFSTTYSPGASCAPAPAVKLFPNLSVL